MEPQMDVAPPRLPSPSPESPDISLVEPPRMPSLVATPRSCTSPSSSMPRQRSRTTFWELHKQLAECYEADMACLEERGGQISHLHPQTIRKRVQSLSQPQDGEKRSDNPRGSFAPGRRDKSLKTLLKVQGQSLAASATEAIELKPHDCWTSSNVKPQGPMVRQKLSEERGERQYTKSRREIETPITLEEAASPMVRKCVLHPGGTWRTFWNVLVALCIFYDLLVIPLYVFDIPSNVFLAVAGWYIQLFWNADFVISFFTGFYDEGTLVLAPSRIACHYARTWMLFDISLISMDWSFVVMDTMDAAEAASLQWSRSLRMLRFLRLVRMLRWVKLRRVNEVFQEYFHSQAASLYYGLASSIAHLMILNHLIACAWFGVSRLSTDNWVLDSNIEEEWMGHQYLVCLNWAFAQLGVGSSSAKPTNSLEFAFCILITFRSLITSSTLISTVSNLMAGLSKIKEDENTEFRLLRCYLSHNDIQPELGQKVTQFLQHQYTLRQEARSADMDVPLLELLSHQLRGELQFARHRKSLRKLAFVDDMIEGEDLQTLHVLHRLAMTALSNASVASKDIIFFSGTRASHAYLKLSGDLIYFTENAEEESVDSSAWIAEICLWTPWVYLGDLMAEDVTRLAILDADQFCEIMAQSWLTQRAAAKHARQYLETLRLKQDQTEWTDLFPRDDPQRSVSAGPFAADLPKQCCPRFFSKTPQGSTKVRRKVAPAAAKMEFDDVRGPS